MLDGTPRNGVTGMRQCGVRRGVVVRWGGARKWLMVWELKLFGIFYLVWRGMCYMIVDSDGGNQQRDKGKEDDNEKQN